MSKSSLVVVPIRDFDALEKVWDEWATLVAEARPGCPFVHPAWSVTWAKHHVAEQDLEFLAFRLDNPDGELVGMAPMHRRRRSLGFARSVALLPVGAGYDDALTEVVEIVARPDRRQDILRAMVAHVEYVDDADWAQLPVGPEQGWMLPQWIDDPRRRVLLHRTTKACVVLDELPERSDMVLPGLKRNLRESLRRTRNRSARLGGVTYSCVDDPDEIEVAVEHLVRLHGARSEVSGKVKHAHVLRDGAAEFLREAVARLADVGLAQVHLARHLDKPVAAQLVLSDGHGDYISVSGLDPEYWDLSFNTTLVYRAVVEAVDRGRALVNLSAGPNIAKGRWSSKILSYNEFDLVHQKRRSRWVYTTYAHTVLGRQLRHERRRHLAE